MKKTVSLFIVLSLIVCAFAGCHGSGKSTAFEVPEQFDESRNYELTFWAKNDTNLRQTQIYKDAIASFENLYPNVKITLKLYTDYGRIYNDVITNISTNTTPNICITYPDHIATYLTGANTVVPLDRLFTDKNYGLGGELLKFDSPAKDEIVPEFLNECMFNGYYYALPYMRSTEACYVNKTYVEALGYKLPSVLTWDFIWEVSDAATAKNSDGTYKINGQKVMIPFIYKSTDNMMIQMLKQKDAGYSSPAGEIRIFNDDTKEILYTVAEHVKKGAFSTFKISSYPGNFFNAGQCIFAIDSTAGASWIGSDAPLSDIAQETKVDFETVVMTIPQYDTENPKMISQGPSVCIFNKEDPQEVLASWMFMQFLLTNDVQTAYAETEGYVPVTLKAQNSTEYLSYLAKSGTDNDGFYKVKIDASQLLLANMENTFVTPVFNGSVSLRDASGQMIENVAKSIRRGETVDEAYMDKLYSDVSSLYRLNQGKIADSSAGKANLGKLPTGSVVLISALGVIWLLIAAYFIYTKIKSSRISKKSNN